LGQHVRQSELAAIVCGPPGARQHAALWGMEEKIRSARKPCLVGGAAERARNGGAWEKRGEGIGNQV